MAETNNRKSTDVPIAKVMVEMRNPNTGEVETQNLEGEGIIFGLLRGEEDAGNGKTSYNIAAGAFGRFNNTSTAATMDAIDESIYSEHPTVQMMRDLKRASEGSGKGVLESIMDLLVGESRNEDDEDEDEHEDEHEDDE
jgi:hypothetical protein